MRRLIMAIVLAVALAGLASVPVSAAPLSTSSASLAPRSTGGLNGSASASDPGVLVVRDTTNAGAGCRMKVTLDPGTSRARVLRQTACPAGTVMSTAMVRLSQARSQHQTYLTLPTTAAAVQTLITSTTRATRAAHPDTFCGQNCYDYCNSTLKVEWDWTAEFSYYGNVYNFNMYSFVNYTKDLAPTCFSVIFMGQTGIKELPNQTICCYWGWNHYAGHNDDLYNRTLPVGTLETFTDHFSSSPGYDEVMDVTDGDDNWWSGVSGPLN